MLSAFTFKFPVPYNPFSAPPVEAAQQRASDNYLNQATANHAQLSRRSPVPSISPVRRDLKRPRAWEPASSSSQNLAATTYAETSGYLDTPAKYRDLASQAPDNADFSMVDMRQEEPSDLPPEPPAKRRRGLAGSIVSTAVSAALIGSAVGLTVYRLWRDRGKETPQAIAPPPPYQEGVWASSSPAPAPEPKVTVTPATPHSRNKRARQHVHSPSGTASRRRRRQRGQGPGFSPQPTQPSFVTPPPEFQFGSSKQNPSDDDDDEQMDALGSRLTYLIEQGRKALGTEVVVQSEVQEDLVDDGDGDWIDEDDPSSMTRRRSGSVRRSRTGHATPNHSHPSSPQEAEFGFARAPPVTIPGGRGSASHIFAPYHQQSSSAYTSSSLRSSHGFPGPSSHALSGYSATPSPSTSVREDPSAWGSDAIRENMERARAKAREARDNFR